MSPAVPHGSATRRSTDASATTSASAVSGSTGNVHRVLAGPESRQAAPSSLAYSRYAALLRPCLATFWRSPEPGSVFELSAVSFRQTSPVDPLVVQRDRAEQLDLVLELGAEPLACPAAPFPDEGCDVGRARLPGV